MASGDLIPRIYSNFRGVDFRGEDINIMRSPDSLNMWKDYKEIDSIRTRPEFKKVNLLFLEEEKKTVWGMNKTINSSGKKSFYFHIGNKIYSCTQTQEDTFSVLPYWVLPLDFSMNERKSSSFVFNDNVYTIDGKKYRKNLSEVKGYVPTTSIGRKPLGGGTVFEDVNMLSDYRINTFCATGEDKEFYLDTQFIDEDFEPIVMLKWHSSENFQLYNKYASEISTDFNYHNKTGFENYYYNGSIIIFGVDFDYEKGKVIFSSNIAAPQTDGQDNVWVLFKKAVGVREKIEKCTMLEVFDNRVFFSGNPDHPNMIWHSSLENPEYISDLDYYEEGLDSSAVTGMVAGNNALWVMKEPSPSNTTVFYHTPTIDSEYGKIYPSTHSNIAIGCIGKAINFNDDIVFFSERGMEGVHGDVTTEQVLGHRSTLIDKKLLNEPNYKDMVLIEWEGYLFVFIGNKVYLADSRAKFTNENHMEYEWFYWEIDHIVTSAMVDDGVLYIGTTDGIYKLTDTTSPVKSYWTTPKDKFKYPQYMKTTNKRGCVSEVTGDVSVYIKTDKTNDFEWINSYYNVTDKIVSRIKRKKFKDIQLKFASDTRFSLESATLECFIGGYIKR